MANPDLNLGDIARDTVTGYEGTVVARTEWMNGCWRLTLQAKLDKDGKPHDGYTFDDKQLELVSRRVQNVPEETLKRTGGPRPEPRQTGL